MKVLVGRCMQDAGTGLDVKLTAVKLLAGLAAGSPEMRHHLIAGAPPRP